MKDRDARDDIHYLKMDIKNIKEAIDYQYRIQVPFGADIRESKHIVQIRSKIDELAKAVGLIYKKKDTTLPKYVKLIKTKKRSAKHG